MQFNHSETSRRVCVRTGRVFSLWVKIQEIQQVPPVSPFPDFIPTRVDLCVCTSEYTCVCVRGQVCVSEGV